RCGLPACPVSPMMRVRPSWNSGASRHVGAVRMEIAMSSRQRPVYRLEHVGLGARRDAYEATVRFYEEIFGWHRLRELPGELVFLGDGAGARLEIFPTDLPPLDEPHHLSFSVPPEEFDAVREALVRAGAQPE